jgi:hypothetical protein
MPEYPEVGAALAVCTGRRCGVRGWILTWAARRLGWRVIRAECLHACRFRPVVIAYPSGRLYGRVTRRLVREWGLPSRETVQQIRRRRFTPPME